MWTGVGTCYRLIVLAANMTFGLLSGLQPLLPAGSLPALCQTLIIMILQLGMATLCFYILPDADVRTQGLQPRTSAVL